MIVIASVILASSKALPAATLHGSLLARGEIQLFSAPDESSTVIATVKPGDEISPLAETLVGEGVRWYLVNATNQKVGWIKQGDTDQSKQLERFFKSLPAEPALPLAHVLPSPRSASFVPNKITVPVVMNGTSVIVPVTFNGSLRGNLALDTGATITVVSRRIANNLAMKALGASKIGTVGGVIRVPLARLRSLKVGDAEVHDLVVSIHDFSTDPRIEGLLGLDFLKHFHVSLDARRGALTLGPR
ncbi:MAG TPA: aspartyl protease family protein [Candidatus Binatia bacterium]|nr:aspartyl protease family protein [Candidatus Binatia bacterium]